VGEVGAPAALDPANVDAVLQRIWLELYRDNFEGALRLAEQAHGAVGHPRYAEQVEKIRGWLAHCQTPDAYTAAYEDYYRGVKRQTFRKRLERRLRTLSGKRTRKMVARVARQDEFRLMEREVIALGARRVLDAGCGEGRVALALGARHPETEVVGLEVTATNVALARELNRFPNVRFEQGLIEDVRRRFPAGHFDLVYSFAVLEHVRDLDAAVGAILCALRPGGRFCFSVPMNEFAVTGPLPEFVPDHLAGHVRVFSEAELRERFGRAPGFTLTKLPGEWRAAAYPPQIVPIEFGVHFVTVSGGASLP
jgi:SAM-dependent methyltransferase